MRVIFLLLSLFYCSKSQYLDFKVDGFLYNGVQIINSLNHQPQNSYESSRPVLQFPGTRSFRKSSNLLRTVAPNVFFILPQEEPDTTLPPTTTTRQTNLSSHCKNGGSGPFCCLNGAPNVDCCTNGGKGRFCCKNGAKNIDCCPNEGSGPHCCKYIDPRPICPRYTT